VAQAHPTAQDLSAWARRHGSIKPELYKVACETGGNSYNTYQYMDEEGGMVCRTTYEP
jgi:hypothetical protein